MMQYQHEQREKSGYTGPRPGFPKPYPELRMKMLHYLEGRELDFALAEKNEWYPSHYKKADRVVIPCSNTQGVPYFQARDMDGKSELRYASPPASRDDSLALVWPRVRVKGTVVVEGPMDALAAAAFGWLGVGIMGNQPSESVLTHLAQVCRAFQPVYVIPDMDALFLGPAVFCPLVQRGISGAIRMPQSKDLCEMTLEERKKFLREGVL